MGRLLDLDIVSKDQRMKTNSIGFDVTLGGGSPWPTEDHAADL